MTDTKFYPLSAWVNRDHPLPSRFYDGQHMDTPCAEWSAWVGLEEVKSLHEADKFNWQGLENSRKITDDYLSHASDLIGGLDGGWLDREEREMILSDIGKPPKPCLPIYIVSTIGSDGEDIQYIGKTRTETRFKGGHSAALKLLNPKYDGLEKKIYCCSVWFHIEDEYIALEWIQPKERALEILDSVESHLIYHLQPLLNTQKKKNNKILWEFYIHIQNFIGTNFLNDKFI